MFGIAFDSIADTRPKHLADFAYFYYLPFAKVFASSDKLHRLFAPHFMRRDQVFVDGGALKADLKRLSEYHEYRKAEIAEQGVIQYSAFPPRSGNFLIAQIYDKCYPEWREHSLAGKPEISVEKRKEIFERAEQAARAAAAIKRR